jgi:hypothetical protein
LEQEHPFLSEESHRTAVINSVQKFLKENLNLNFDQIKIGHLFFGQRVMPLAGRDIGFIYSDKARYYPLNEDASIKPGILILVDEVGSRFDIGISEISKDDLGVYFENILINIQISKDVSTGTSSFDLSNFFFEIYSINNYGALVNLGLHSLDKIQELSSRKILDIILFNLEKFA